jgi:hypothetical protein
MAPYYYARFFYIIIFSTLIHVNEIIKYSVETDPELAEFYANFYPVEDEDEGVVDGPIGDLVGEWIANFDHIDDYVWMVKVTTSLIQAKNVLVCLCILNQLFHASYVVFNVSLPFNSFDIFVCSIFLCTLPFEAFM